jgi:beta-N-acetylhexosaminidase
MTLEEKVGQLVVVAGNASSLDERSEDFRRLARHVVGQHVGGVIWYRSKVLETAALAGRLQEMAATPLLFSCDLEAGMGMRFDDTSWAPSAMAIAATGDPGLAERLGRATAQQARAIGVHHLYAPVADVNVNPDNPVINVRSFGEDPEEVARYVAAFCRGVEAGGGIATLKHFPGHGDTSVDSHRSLPVLKVARERLDRVELVPFRAGLAAGARSVMVGHLSVPALDPTPAPVLPAARRRNIYAGSSDETETAGTLPATLSPAITGLLRRELGFDGLIVTDAMDMGGIADHFEPGEAAVRAVLAGADQVLKSNDPDAAIAALVGAARSGRISRERLDASVERVLREKRRLGLFERRTPPREEVARVVGAPEHEALLEEIARRSLTLLEEAPGVLPLRPSARIAHVVVSDEVSPSSGAVLAAELARRAQGRLRTARLDPGSIPGDVHAALEAARSADVVVLSLLIRARSGSGGIALPEVGAGALSKLADLETPIVALLLGSPYVLRDLPRFRTSLAAYGSQDVVQRAAARALYGESAVAGRLPVTIPKTASRGAGIRKDAGR